MMSKMKCFGLFAGCALATGALHAAAYSETFDSSSSWTGGELRGSNYAFRAEAGLPISGSTQPAGNKVLVIEGNASYSREALSGSPVVDMMVQTARPDDELGFPSSEDTTTIQIAVAVDSDGYFNAYCKNKSDVVGWYKLSNTPTDATGWARVSFLFDYTNHRCQIRINGEPVMSTNGYLTATSTEASSLDNKGAWYKLAKSDATGVANMKVIGCTAIDEVVMNNEASYTYPLAANAEVDGVPCAWYDQYGLAWAGDVSYDASGMTVAQKYNACLSPLDGQTFAIKSMTTTATKAVVGVPATVATDGRKVVLDYGTDPTFETGTTTTDVAAGATTVEIDLPAAGAVKYCRLLATTASAQ